MPNAKTYPHETGKNILCFGHTGAGKTQQFATLPGKKFAYFFDTNSLDTLTGEDIDFEEFYPEKLNLAITSLKKGTAPATRSKHAAINSYERWEKHFEESIENGFFDQYDNIMLDSLTTFSDMVMDTVLKMNGRDGQWPQQDDYGPQMNAIAKVMRVLTALGKRVYVTGHMKMDKDEVSQRVYFQPLVTGQLKTKLPLLFSQIFYCEAEAKQTGTQRGVQYNLQTKPDRQTPLIRCTLKGLEYKEDVTLDLTKPIEGQGLGGLILKQK